MNQYDTIADAYTQHQRKHFEELDWSRIFIDKHVQKGCVLDVGCGAGDDMKRLSENGCDVVGIDTSKRMVELAVEQGLDARVADVRELPFRDDSFDAVIARYSLHYVKELDEAYEEIYRVIKEGGVLVLMVANPVFDALFMKQEYGSEFQVEMPLYGGVVVRYPAHRLADFLSPRFLELFRLEGFEEALQTEVNGVGLGIASALGLLATAN